MSSCNSRTWLLLKYRLNISEAEIVAALLRELILAESVEQVQLLVDSVEFLVDNRCELDLDDDNSIRNHHSHAFEKYL